jgi:hypothetical protein
VLQQPALDGQIPGVCYDTCESLWNDALANPASATPIDVYSRPGDEEDGCMAGTENSGTALVATDEFSRQVVLVDQCSEHGTDVSEQGYIFRCPLPLE